MTAPALPPDPADTAAVDRPRPARAVRRASRAAAAAFVWEQDGRTSRLDLRGPLGAGALQVVASPDGLTLTDGAGRSVDAEAARAGLRARLGADLPWDSLPYWMLGVPAPEAPATVTDAEAVPRRVIEQAGWRIGYEAYTTAAGPSLPQRFTATRENVRVKVIVDAWTLRPAQRRP